VSSPAPCVSRSSGPIGLLARLTLGILILAPALYVLSHGVASVPVIAIRTVTTIAEIPWLAAPGQPWTGGVVEALILLISGTSLILGVAPKTAAALTGITLVRIAVAQLVRDPIYDVSSQLGLLLLVAVVILLLPQPGRIGLPTIGRPRLLRRDLPGGANISTLLVRLFFGSIFFAQGWHDTVTIGPIAFARQEYVDGFHQSFLPAPALWVMGTLNPPTQLATGACIVVGLMTRWAAFIAGLFLATIIFGHVVADPTMISINMLTHVLANMTAVLVLLAIEPCGNQWCLDNLMRK
jgi:uncharacterized membrane protein YphA (DoxX/SURF4 family)